MTVRIWDEYESWPIATRMALQRKMENLAKFGRDHFPDTHFRSEGRHAPKGSANGVIIYAIKESHFRLYGGFVTVNGVSTFFICTACDAAKKQPKADPAKLQSAADRLKKFL